MLEFNNRGESKILRKFSQLVTNDKNSTILYIYLIPELQCPLKRFPSDINELLRQDRSINSFEIQDYFR
jgi:hypothetical protein